MREKGSVSEGAEFREAGSCSKPVVCSGSFRCVPSQPVRSRRNNIRKDRKAANHLACITLSPFHSLIPDRILTRAHFICIYFPKLSKSSREFTTCKLTIVFGKMTPSVDIRYRLDGEHKHSIFVFILSITVEFVNSILYGL